MGLLWLLMVSGLGAYAGHRVIARRDARWRRWVDRDPKAFAGENSGVPAIASLEHLQPAKAPEPGFRSPYRAIAEDPSDAQQARLRRRAQTALNTARWLLMSAVEDSFEAEALARRGDHRGADMRTMAQNRSECEALQCVFEAEECLGIRIVRDPDEPRCFARFYGQASHLVVIVAAFCEQMFEGRGLRVARGA